MSQKNTPPEPFGHFKADPFGWSDCAETDYGAQPLYDQAAIDELGEKLMVAEQQRDTLLAAIEQFLDPEDNPPTDTGEWREVMRVIASVKGGAA